MRGLPYHTQQKKVASDPNFLWWLSPCKKVSIENFLDIDDQKILQSDWWLTAFQATPEGLDFLQTCSFCRIIKYRVAHHF